jgi:hypothetical protein
MLAGRPTTAAAAATSFTATTVNELQFFSVKVPHDAVISFR